MERSADDTTASRFRTRLSGAAKPWAGAATPWEVVGVAGVTAVTWRLTLGWNWSSIATVSPVRTAAPQVSAPQTDLDWLILAIVVAAGVGWLARRGYPVAGALAIWTPIVVLSGWRLAAAGIAGWPISLASLIFVLSAICIVAAGGGAWLRHQSSPRLNYAAAGESVDRAAAPSPAEADSAEAAELPGSELPGSELPASDLPASDLPVAPGQPAQIPAASARG